MKRDPKKFVLPHSEAKLNLYSEYLKRYLRILILNPYVDKISIYDLFCGTGIYKDNKKGSPILSFEIIKELFDEFKQNGKTIKPIKLIVNDGEVSNINNVKIYLNKLNTPKICDIEFHVLDSKEMFNVVKEQISKQNKREKGLIFIDPYGYKEIHRLDIYDLMKSHNTEIIMFLPISHMYRFKSIALKDFNNKSYEKLRQFLLEFFEKSHPIHTSIDLNINDFIKYIKESLTFKNENENYYVTSFYIQRDQANFNALFFITTNLFGYEKIIDVKWELDPRKGQGSRLKDNYSLFDKEPFRELDIPFNVLLREGIIKNNIDLYRLTLNYEHPIKHINELLRTWKAEGKLEVRDISTDKINNRGFYIKYKEYKNNNPKVYIKLLE